MESWDVLYLRNAQASVEDVTNCRLCVFVVHSASLGRNGAGQTVINVSNEHIASICMLGRRSIFKNISTNLPGHTVSYRKRPLYELLKNLDNFKPNSSLYDIYTRSKHRYLYQKQTSMFIPEANIDIYTRSIHRYLYQEHTSIFIPGANFDIYTWSKHRYLYQE